MCNKSSHEINVNNMTNIDLNKSFDINIQQEIFF